MNEVISVIVPVYNVDRYITKCLESLVNQTYQNLEILLVDDGSTDRSGSICDEFGGRDPRITVIHQKNAGAAAARNSALDRATGTYLTFVDSDDWVEPDAYSYMVEQLEKENADIIHCGFRDIYVGREEEHPCDIDVAESDQIAYLVRFTEDWTCGLLWNKLYKRKLFSGIHFETGHIIDDEYYTYQGVMNAQKVIFREKIVYNYRKRKSGAVGSAEHAERIVSDKLDYLSKRRDMIKQRYPELTKTFNRHLLFMLNWMASDSDISLKGLERIREKLRKEWKQCRFSGEGWRTDLKLLKLMRSDPRKTLDDWKTSDSTEKQDDLFE